MFHVFYFGYWLLAIGDGPFALCLALIFWFCFIVFDFIRFMLLGSPPFSGDFAVMLVGYARRGSAES